MPSKVRSLRSAEKNWERWEKAATSAGLSSNAWIVKALNSAAELEEALRRQEKVDASPPVSKVVVSTNVSTSPKPKGCGAYAPKGTKCKLCGKSH